MPEILPAVLLTPVFATPHSRTLKLKTESQPKKTLEEGPVPREPTQAAALGPGPSASARFWRCITRVQHRVSVPDLKQSRLFQFCFAHYVSVQSKLLDEPLESPANERNRKSGRRGCLAGGPRVQRRWYKV